MYDFDLLSTGMTTNYAVCFRAAVVEAFSVPIDNHTMRVPYFEEAFDRMWAGDALGPDHFDRAEKVFRDAEIVSHKRAFRNHFPPYPKATPKTNLWWIKRFLPKFLQGTGLIGFDCVPSSRHPYVSNGILHINPRSMALPALRNFRTGNFFPITVTGLRPTWGCISLYEYYVGGIRREPNRLRFSYGKVIMTSYGILGASVPHEIDLHYF